MSEYEPLTDEELREVERDPGDNELTMRLLATIRALKADRCDVRDCQFLEAVRGDNDLLKSRIRTLEAERDRLRAAHQRILDTIEGLPVPSAKQIEVVFIARAALRSPEDTDTEGE